MTTVMMTRVYVRCSTHMSVGAFLIEELCVHSTVRAWVSLFLPSSPRAPPPSRVTSAWRWCCHCCADETSVAVCDLQAQSCQRHGWPLKYVFEVKALWFVHDCTGEWCADLCHASTRHVCRNRQSCRIAGDNHEPDSIWICSKSSLQVAENSKPHTPYKYLVKHPGRNAIS